MSKLQFLDAKNHKIKISEYAVVRRFALNYSLEFEF
jgi:hypothetical protein